MSFNNTNTDILIAGAFAAFSVDFLVYPLDTIKTRLQSPDYKRLYTNASTRTVNRSLFRGLYQGIGSVILATVPSSSSTGELVSCLILTPAEVLKQNAQMVTRSTSPRTSTNKIFDGNATIIALKKFNSPTQLWRGYTALAGRNLPFTAMQFPMFEYLRTRIHAHRKRRGKATGSLLESGFVTALSAGSAGSVAAVITTPIDVVKTRIMLSAPDHHGSEEHTKLAKELKGQGKDPKAELEKAQQQAARGGRAGGLAVGREILRTEGVKGLFRGGALRGLWTALGSGLYLGVYESGRRYLEERRVGKNELAIA
ncbi:MAG: hypothetical protein Q9164_001784 [Protoblastenia rupestris]